MGSIVDYVKKYGNFSFEEEEFNDIDNVIFSLISYVNFTGIISPNGKPITLKEAADRYFSTYSKKDIKSNIFSIKSAIGLFELIKDYDRYKNVELYNYIYSGNVNKQFSALSIRINKGFIYVSFEGTDELISGWKEDFELSYMFPIPAHEEAINYLNNTIKLSDKKVIIGGHSKGGNLALVASMYCSFWIRNKIIKIYSNDGPGLLEEELQSRKLKKVKSKYIHLIPDYSIVGVLLGNFNNEVISSSKKGILAHDALNWKVEGTHFVSSTLDDSSQDLSDILDKWLSEYNFEQRMIFVQELFELFERNEIYTLLDIKKKGFRFVIDIIKNSKEFDSITKEMLKQLITLVYNDYTIKIKEKFTI